MSYFAPFIDASGFHIPTYDDINTFIQEAYASIYGLGTVQQIAVADYQRNSIFALMVNDLFQAALLAYNGNMPGTAIGSQQDLLYKLCGIARLGSTFSTATVTVSGTVGTELIGRVAQDTNGNLWTLPTDFVIPSSGSIDVIAVCQTAGPITAPIGTISIPNNPTAGWNTVSNAAAAVPGTNVETDSAFRARQALSVALPSRTLVNATIAAIAQVAGVTRYGTIGVENPTGAVDSYGNPAHSISMVVEGGTNADVANAIYLQKTPGCATNGTTTVNVADPITGTTMPINFFRPTTVPIFVAITVHGLNGYTTATTTAVQTAIVNYLNSLLIGESLTISALYGAALAVMPNLSIPQFSITQLKAGTSVGSEATTDIAINFNQVVSGIAANVTVTVV